MQSELQGWRSITKKGQTWKGVVHILEEVWWQPTGVEKSAGLPKRARGPSLLAGRQQPSRALASQGCRTEGAGVLWAPNLCGCQTWVYSVCVWEAGQGVQAKDAKSPETALCVHSCSRASLGVLPPPAPPSKQTAEAHHHTNGTRKRSHFLLQRPSHDLYWASLTYHCKGEMVRIQSITTEHVMKRESGNLTLRNRASCLWY